MKNTFTLTGLALALAASNLFGADGTGMNVQQFPSGFTVASGATKVFPSSATATFEFSGVPSEGDTVTIDKKVYTFHAALSNADGNVLIGTNNANSATNLFAAISLGAGSGTIYAAATTLHPSVTAAMGASNSVVLTARVPGLAGNSILISDTSVPIFPALNQRTLAGGTAAEVFVLPLNGLGFSFAVSATNTTLVNQSNAIATFALSGDGTNFATVAPGLFTLSVPVNGTTNAVIFTNMPAATVGNARKARLVSVNNQDTNSSYITVLGASVSSTFAK